MCRDDGQLWGKCVVTIIWRAIKQVESLVLTETNEFRCFPSKNIFLFCPTYESVKNLIKALRSKILTYNVANFLVSIILFYDQRAFVILATKVKKLHLFFSLGFSTWLVQYLVTLRGLPVWVINLIVSIIAAIMTEVVSNTATANVLLPILWEMSLTICQNPTYLGNNVTDKMFLLFVPGYTISNGCLLPLRNREPKQGRI